MTSNSFHQKKLGKWALGGAERGHPFFRHPILAKRVCSQKLMIKGKRSRFVRSFTKENTENFDEN